MMCPSAIQIRPFESWHVTSAKSSPVRVEHLDRGAGVFTVVHMFHELISKHGCGVVWNGQTQFRENKNRLQWWSQDFPTGRALTPGGLPKTTWKLKKLDGEEGALVHCAPPRSSTCLLRTSCRSLPNIHNNFYTCEHHFQSNFIHCWLKKIFKYPKSKQKLYILCNEMSCKFSLIFKEFSKLKCFPQMMCCLNCGGQRRQYIQMFKM